MTNTFLLFWCNEGLEGIESLDMDLIHDETFKILRKEENATKYSHSIFELIRIWQLRARFNAQRCYECYKLETKDISKNEICDLFKDNPQQIVNLIRENGILIFGRPAEKSRIIIV